MSFDKLKTDLNEFEADARTFWQKFRANVVYWWHYATAWVSGLWFAILAYWGSLDKSEQINTIGNFLPAKMVSPLLALLAVVSYFIAKGWPQPVTAAKVEVKQAMLAATDAATGPITQPAK